MNKTLMILCTAIVIPAALFLMAFACLLARFDLCALATGLGLCALSLLGAMASGVLQVFDRRKGPQIEAHGKAYRAALWRGDWREAVAAWHRSFFFAFREASTARTLTTASLALLIAGSAVGAYGLYAMDDEALLRVAHIANRIAPV